MSDETINIDSPIIVISVVLGLSSFILGSIIMVIIYSTRKISQCSPWVGILSYIYGVLSLLTVILFFKLFSKYSTAVQEQYFNIFCSG